jgi:hypothetical protein
VAACAACGFANAREDRYCGGCGDNVGVVVARPEPAPVVEPEPVRSDSKDHKIDELAGLFDTPKSERKLPAAGIAQDDIDHLFGGTAS